MSGPALRGEVLSVTNDQIVANTETFSRRNANTTGRNVVVRRGDVTRRRVPGLADLASAHSEGGRAVRVGGEGPDGSDGPEEITVEQLNDLLIEATQYWLPPDPADDESPNFLDWANSRFDLTVGTPKEFKELHDLHLEKVEQIAVLQNLFTRRGLLGDECPDGESNSAQFARLYELATHAFYVVESERRCRNIVNPCLQEWASLEAATFRFKHLDPSMLNETQSLIMFLLKKLYAYGLRRYRGKCYEQIVVKEIEGDPTSPEHRTHAWQSWGDIGKFIHHVTRKEVYAEQWLNLTKSRNVPRHCIEYLEACYDPEFPELVPDRHVTAYRNGIYHAKQMRFLRYGRDEIPRDLVACKFFDLEFPEHLATTSTRWYEDIDTPVFQSIIDYQRMGDDSPAPDGGPSERELVNRWVYTIFGRLMYDVNEIDMWQVIAFVKGIAGSGKNTIARVAENMYDPSDVAALSSGGFDEKFGLSGIYGKFLFVCSEVKENFRLNQGDLQNMISGENVSVNIKFKTTETVRWTTPGLLLGNELASWIDAQGSMSRRLVLFEFLRKVLNSDPSLPSKLADEMALLILKCNIAYRTAAHFYRRTDIWQVLPKYFLDTQARLKSQINPLIGFLQDEAVFDQRDQSRFVSQDVFVDRYNSWLRSKNFKPMKFVRDHYESVFEEFEMRVVCDVRNWDGVSQHGYFITGIGMRPQPTVFNGHQRDTPSPYSMEGMQAALRAVGQDEDGDDGSME